MTVAVRQTAVAAVGAWFAFLKEPVAVPAACLALSGGERRTVISFSTALCGCGLNFRCECSREEHGHNKLLG